MCAEMWINEALCMHTHNQSFLMCMRCTHTLTLYLLLVRSHVGVYCTQETLHKNTQSILSCASVVRHNSKVQQVILEEAITGLYTSSPVSPAFCLSADAVKPSIFPLLHPCLLTSNTPPPPPSFYCI